MCRAGLRCAGRGRAVSFLTSVIGRCGGLLEGAAVGEDQGGNGVTRKRPAGVRLSFSAPRDPAVAALSDGAFRLWVTALCHCVEHRTDGFVTADDLHRMRLYVRRKRPLLDELTAGEHSLLIPVDGGYLMRGFLEYQYSRDQHENHREAGARRQARHRARKRGNGVGNGVTPEQQSLPEPDSGNGVAGDGVTALVTGKLSIEGERPYGTSSPSRVTRGAVDVLGAGQLPALLRARPAVREALDVAARTGELAHLADVYATGTQAERDLADALSQSLQPDSPRTDGWVG